MDGPQVRDQSFEHPHNLKLKVRLRRRSSLAVPLGLYRVCEHAPPLPSSMTFISSLTLTDNICRLPMRLVVPFVLSVPLTKDIDMMECIASQR